jgi:hypothetical protein
MPGCVLRATGDCFEPQGFLDDSSLVPCNIFRKGERKAQNRSWSSSGFTVVVSEASGDDLAQQIQDAIEFLRMHKTEVARLMRFEGLEGVDLDFGVNRKNDFLQSSRLPPELLTLAGALGVGVEVSIYGEDES